MKTEHNAGSRAGSRRRIMRSLKINEISAVDVPAQEGAVAVIMKRRDPAEGPEKQARAPDPQTEELEFDLEKNAALTTVEDGHTHLLALRGPPDGDEVNSGMTSWVDGHSHPWIRTADDEIVIGVARGELVEIFGEDGVLSREPGVPHTHTIAAVSKVDEDEDPTKETSDMATNKDEKTGGDEAQVEELKKKLARADSIADLSDAEKEVFGTLKGDEADAYLAKPADERKADIEKAAKDAAEKVKDEDPVVYTTEDGIDLRKSAGEAFVALAKSNDAIRKENKDLRDGREQDSLEKRAESELPHLPGDVKVRAALLKAIDGIEDDSQREAALNALKAQNEALSTAFKTAGHGGTPEAGSADDELNKLAQDHKDKNPELTIEQAHVEVLKTERGGNLYNKTLN